MIKVHIDGGIYRSAPHGGISRVMTQMMRCLMQERQELRALLALPAGAAPVPPLGSRCRQFRYGRFPSLLNVVLRGWRPDIFHSTYYTLASGRQTKTVMMVYDFIDRRFPELAPNGAGFVARQRRAIEAADALIANSETTRQDILTFTRAPAEKIVVAYCGLTDCFAPGPDLESAGRQFRDERTGGRPYWLHVGLRRNYKNFDVLLQAFCALAAVRDMQLVLLGGAPGLEARQRDLLIRHGCAERVRLLPLADDRQLRAAYAGATAFVQCSLWEGFGIPLVEAAGCGAPLVVSDIPVFREVAGEAALYADPRNPGAWVAALEATLSAAQRTRLQELSRTRFAGRFTWAAAAQQVWSVYVRLAG